MKTFGCIYFQESFLARSLYIFVHAKQHLVKNKGCWDQTLFPCPLCFLGPHACRDKVKSYETKVAIETEDRKRALAEKVEKATFEQLESQINDDWRLIREQRPPKATADMDTALDMKYVKSRQQILC